MTGLCWSRPAAGCRRHPVTDVDAYEPWMAYQREVGHRADASHPAPRLLHRHAPDASHNSWQEASQLEEVHPSDSADSDADAEDNTQPYYAHPRYRLARLPNASSHPETDALQESVRTVTVAMGSAATTTARLPQRAPLVAPEYRRLGSSRPSSKRSARFTSSTTRQSSFAPTTSRP